MPTIRRAAAILVALLLGAALASCGGPADASPFDAAERVRAAQLEPGDPVPAPAGPVVLTISGDIEVTNVGDTLQFDLATLELLGLSRYEADDYQAEGRTASFEGPLLADVLAIAGASEEATTLHTTALNDYKADVPISDVEQYPVLVATTVDGDRMPVARYGPVRLVYPNLDVDFDKAVYDARWVWQLQTIEVG